MGGDVTGKRHPSLRRRTGADHIDQLLMVHYPNKKLLLLFSHFFTIKVVSLSRGLMSKDNHVVFPEGWRNTFKYDSKVTKVFFQITFI